MAPATNVEVAGTGFYLASTQRLFMVTARHVLFGNDPASTHLVAHEATLISEGQGKDCDLKAMVHVSLDELLSRNWIRASTNRDVAVLRLGLISTNGSIVFEAGVTNPSRRGLAFDVDQVALFDEVRAGSEAYIVGFPRSLGQSKFAHNAVDPDKPLFRCGIVAGKDRAKRNLIVDAPVYPGNSGGPLILKLKPTLGLEYVRVAGVVSEFVPFERVMTDTRGQSFTVEHMNSGYAVVVPLDEVLSLLW